MDTKLANQVFCRRRGFTLLEVTISLGIFTALIGAFMVMVRLSQQSVRFQTSVAEELRATETGVDNMLVGMRWISQYAQATGGIAIDPDALDSHFPDAGTCSTDNKAPKVVFRRINGYDNTGQYVWGNRITYYWLPSADENPKYANGAIANYSAADIDGIDHDGNGIANDGVIWRKIEAVRPDGSNDPTLLLDPMGLETFDNVSPVPAGGTRTDLRVVMTRVPPPFYIKYGVATVLNSFRVDLSARSFTLTLRRFVDTGRPVDAPGEILPTTLPSMANVLAGSTSETAPGKSIQNTIAIYSTQRTYCLRN